MSKPRTLLKNNNRAFLLAFLIVIFAVTSWYTGDFFGYQRLVELYYPGIENFHLEKVYEYIIQFTKNNYLLFRIVIWGGATLCYVQTVKILKINLLMALFIMFLLFTTTFCYARATLAMGVYFLGLSLLMEGRNSHKVKYVIMGAAILISSYFFHKSLATLIIITTFYFIPLNRKTIIPVILTIIIIGYGIDSLINSFQNVLIGIGDEQLVDKIEQSREVFASRQSKSATFFGWVSIIWGYMPYYLSFYFISKEMLEKSGHPNTMKGLYRITFAIMLLSIVLLFFSAQSITYFYRYLYMSFIPISILIVYLFTKGYFNMSKYKTIIYVCGGYNLWFFFSYLLR